MSSYEPIFSEIITKEAISDHALSALLSLLPMEEFSSFNGSLYKAILIHTKEPFIKSLTRLVNNTPSFDLNAANYHHNLSAITHDDNLLFHYNQLPKTDANIGKTAQFVGQLLENRTRPKFIIHFLKDQQIELNEPYPFFETVQLPEDVFLKRGQKIKVKDAYPVIFSENVELLEELHKMGARLDIRLSNGQTIAEFLTHKDYSLLADRKSVVNYLSKNYSATWDQPSAWALIEKAKQANDIDRMVIAAKKDWPAWRGSKGENLLHRVAIFTEIYERIAKRSEAKLLLSLKDKYGLCALDYAKATLTSQYDFTKKYGEETSAACAERQWLDLLAVGAYSPRDRLSFSTYNVVECIKKENEAASGGAINYQTMSYSQKNEIAAKANLQAEKLLKETFQKLMTKPEMVEMVKDGLVNFALMDVANKIPKKNAQHNEEGHIRRYLRTIRHTFPHDSEFLELFKIVDLVDQLTQSAVAMNYNQRYAIAQYDLSVFTPLVERIYNETSLTVKDITPYFEKRISSSILDHLSVIGEQQTLRKQFVEPKKTTSRKAL